MNILFFLRPKSGVTYLTLGNSLRQGLEKMRYHGRTAVPVVTRENQYVGTLSEGDFLWHIVDIGGASIEDCEDLHIADILKPDRNPPLKITAQASEIVDQLMSRNFLPVTDDSGAFIGIVTRQKLLAFYKNKQ